ncbi:hypothetical protein CHELA1G11_11377 [Hyphomicrobiales bacterium]|nr:hypothetical protein CHELA1G11_11377 [Hyphomicrobiales bacterium]CAH1668197.1 hypothetical protein CHELA1G2_12933 [Hyphomicrobiales bacterium]
MHGQRVSAKSGWISGNGMPDKGLEALIGFRNGCVLRAAPSALEGVFAEGALCVQLC